MPEAIRPRRPGLFDRKPIEEAQRETERSGFRRALGALDLTSLGVAAIIGGGIFVGIGEATGAAGPAVIVMFLIAGLACIFTAFAYAELASLVPGSGSAYTYIHVALGRLPAFLAAWFLLLEYLVGNMFVATGWSGYFLGALDDIGMRLPAALRASAFQLDGGGINLPAALIVLAVTALAAIGIRESVRFGNALVVFKLAIVVLVVAVGLFLIHPGNWEPFSPHGVAGITAAASPVFFAYIGFDAVSTTAEEARNPRRDLPRGIVGSLVISMVLYVLVAIVLTGMVSYDGLDPDAPLAKAFSAQGASWAAPLITAGALVATTTVVLAFTIGLPRILHAFARDGFLPSSFTRLHPRFKTPFRLTVVGGIVTAIGAALIPEKIVLDLTSLGTLAIYVLACGGVLVLKRLQPGLVRPFSSHWLFPALGIVFCTYLAFGISTLVHWAFLGWIGAGLMLFGFGAHLRGAGFGTATVTRSGE